MTDGPQTFRLASASAPMDGLFVLDGDVLESFGFGHAESRRVHLSVMESVEVVKKGMVYLKLEGASDGVQQFAQMVDPTDPELDRLVAALQAVIR